MLDTLNTLPGIDCKFCGKQISEKHRKKKHVKKQ